MACICTEVIEQAQSGHTRIGWSSSTWWCCIFLGLRSAPIEDNVWLTTNISGCCLCSRVFCFLQNTYAIYIETRSFLRIRYFVYISCCSIIHMKRHKFMQGQQHFFKNLALLLTDLIWFFFLDFLQKQRCTYISALTSMSFALLNLVDLIWFKMQMSYDVWVNWFGCHIPSARYAQTLHDVWWISWQEHLGQTLRDIQTQALGIQMVYPVRTTNGLDAAFCPNTCTCLSIWYTYPSSWVTR